MKHISHNGVSLDKHSHTFTICVWKNTWTNTRKNDVCMEEHTEEHTWELRTETASCKGYGGVNSDIWHGVAHHWHAGKGCWANIFNPMEPRRHESSQGQRRRACHTHNALFAVCTCHCTCAPTHVSHTAHGTRHTRTRHTLATRHTAHGTRHTARSWVRVHELCWGCSQVRMWWGSV